jgi:hypothetical protein
MTLYDFFAELKRRNVYEVAIARDISPLFEIASLLVCFDIESMAQRRRWLQQLG